MSLVQLVALGNTIMSDDGAGPLALERLAQNKWPCPVTFHDTGIASQYFYDILSGSGPIIIVDALRTGRLPGTVVRLPANRLRLDTVMFSLHDLHLLHIAARFYPDRLQDIYVFGIEPYSLEPGTSLSPPVRQGFPLLVHAVTLAVLGFSKSAAKAPLYRHRDTHARQKV